eukprot:SAG11_NODE_60_length_19094_cov_26.549566_1_plen_85_part_00
MSLGPKSVLKLQERTQYAHFWKPTRRSETEFFGRVTKMRIPVGFSLVVLGRIRDPKTQTQLDAEKTGQKNDQDMKKYELDCRPI